MKQLAFASLALLLAPSFALAHSTHAGDIHIGHSYMIEGEECVQFSLLNQGQTPDALTGISSELSGGSMIDAHSKAVLTSIPLLPGAPVAATSKHVCLKLDKPPPDLKAGGAFIAKLTFEKAPATNIEVKIEKRK